MKSTIAVITTILIAWNRTCHGLLTSTAVTTKVSFSRTKRSTQLRDQQQHHHQQQQEYQQGHDDNGGSRRSFLTDIPRPFIMSMLIGTNLSSFSLIKPAPTLATIMDINTPGASTFKPGQTIGIEEAKERFRLAIKDIDELIDNYDEITKGGNGDNVRRYLGTVGVKSHMYGISKVLKELREEVDDVVEFTETVADFESYLFQAEGAAYQSLFVEYSSAKGSPESFLATARKDIITMRKYMGDLARQLNMDA
jgi:hypothetical protein